jgi:outer membrane lipoprotein
MRPGLKALSLIAALVAPGAAASGCASTVVPESLQKQVDERLTFAQLKESPDSYRGHLVVLGGEVISAKRSKDGTQIEILQLPLSYQEPEWDRTSSQGRFIAIQKEFLDPATIPAGTRVTVVGEVTGAVTRPLDETEYVFPTLEVKSLKVWPDRMSYAQPRPYAGPYYWGGPYWGPYWGRYWYRPYWW